MREMCQRQGDRIVRITERLGLSVNKGPEKGERQGRFTSENSCVFLLCTVRVRKCYCGNVVEVSISLIMVINRVAYCEFQSTQQEAAANAVNSHNYHYGEESNCSV